MRRWMRAVAVGLAVLLLLAVAARPVPSPGRSAGGPHAGPGRRRHVPQPAGRLHPPAAGVVAQPRLQVVRVLGPPRRPGPPGGGVRRRLGLRAGGPHQAGGEAALHRRLPVGRLARPGGGGGAAGRPGPRRDRPVGVRLDRAPGRALRRRLGRRPAGDGPVRRRAHHHGLVPAARVGRAPLAGLPTQVLPFDPAALPARPERSPRAARCASLPPPVPREGAYAVSDGGGHGRAWTRASPSRATPWPAPSTPPPARTPWSPRPGPLPATTDGAGPSGALLPRARGRQAAVCEARATAADRQLRRHLRLPGAGGVAGRAARRRRGPVWIARYITSDTQGAAVTSGPDADPRHPRLGLLTRAQEEPEQARDRQREE